MLPRSAWATGRLRRKDRLLALAGFTLLELLAVIAVIAVLAALLFPVGRSALESSRSAKCVSQLRQIGVGMNAYANENNGMFPACYPADNTTWMWKLATYVGMSPDMMGPAPKPRAAGLFVCPSFKPSENRAVSYLVNGNMNPSIQSYWNYRRITPPPAGTFLVVEGNLNTEQFNPWADGDVSRRHPNHSANFLFVDGHVENIVGPVARDDPRWFRGIP